MSQDIIEGFWDENSETKKLIDIIGLYKFDKILKTTVWAIWISKDSEETKKSYITRI